MSLEPISVTSETLLRIRFKMYASLHHTEHVTQPLLGEMFFDGLERLVKCQVLGPSSRHSASLRLSEAQGKAFFKLVL